MSVKVNSRLSLTTAVADLFMRSRSQWKGHWNDNVTRIRSAASFGSHSYGSSDRRVRGMLRLLYTAALSHVLSAPGRTCAVSRGSGNGDGGPRRRDRPSHARPISYRHGAADRH